MLSSPRRPDTTIRIFSSAVYCLRVLRRISQTVPSAGSFLLIDFCLIFVPFGHYDEPEILRYAITSICPKGADVRQKAMLTNYLLNAARGRMVDGAEAELQSAAGISGHGIPLELWDVARPAEQRSAEGERETRAVTAAPGTVGVNLDAIRPAVFANSIAPRLGIEMPRVMSGTYASATITTSQTAAAYAKSGAAVGTAGSFTVTTATPKRVSARLELTLEDVAAVGQANFESILRENLALALSDQLDNQAINGNGTAPNLAGILQRLSDPTAAPTAAPTAVADFDTFVAAFAAGVDGLWSNTVKEVAIVGGVETYRLSASTFRDPRDRHSGRPWQRGIFGLRNGSLRRLVDKYAHAGPGDVHVRGQRATGDSVPQGPVHDGRRRGHAHGRLPALECH